MQTHASPVFGSPLMGAERCSTCELHAGQLMTIEEDMGFEPMDPVKGQHFSKVPA